MSYWRDKASEAIAQVLANAVAEGWDLENLTQVQKQILKARINAAYPFALRRNYAYQMWQLERSKVFDKYGLNATSAQTTQQLQLFDL